MLVEENLQVNDTFSDVQLASPPSAVESATDSSLDRFIDREAGIRVWMVLALIMGCMLVVSKSLQPELNNLDEFERHFRLNIVYFIYL